MIDRRRQLPFVAFPLLVALAIALGGCAGTAASPTPTEPIPSAELVTTPEAAVDAVVVTEPRLTGIGPLDPDLIGQASWYEVQPASGVGAFIVEVRIGWGDCPAGCIDEHRWVYAVRPDGSVTRQSESGPPVPDDAWPSPGGDGRTGIRLVASAGPVCPVETPDDPDCAPRPVEGAVVVIRDAAGNEVVRATVSGTAFVELPARTYVVEPQPVEGLMGTASPVEVTVVEGSSTLVHLDYDTGIR